MSLEILDGIEEEIRSFSEAERPLWPDCPTRCPVGQCDQRILFPTVNNFIRHWSKLHMPQIKLYECPCCSFVSAREYNIRRHLGQRHKLITTQAITSRNVENTNYINPTDVQPYRYNHRSRMIQKRKEMDTPASVLVRGGEVCRDQEADLDGSITFKKSKK